MKKELTCIICPIGCPLIAEMHADGTVRVNGNTCPRGEQYAIGELTHPERTLTTTVRTSNGQVIPVKTARAIPKELLFDAMKVIDNLTVPLPVHVEDCVISDLFGTGVDVIATANMD